MIDKSKLGDTEFDNLLFLWYDEENDNFVELDTMLDEGELYCKCGDYTLQ